MKAVLLAGGPVGKLTLESGDNATSKGLVKVGGQPLAWRTLLAGTLATCLSAAVVGALPYQLFAGVHG